MADACVGEKTELLCGRGGSGKGRDSASTLHPGEL